MGEINNVFYGSLHLALVVWYPSFWKTLLYILVYRRNFLDLVYYFTLDLNHQED